MTLDDPLATLAGTRGGSLLDPAPPANRGAATGDHRVGGEPDEPRWRRVVRLAADPVVAALLLAAVLHLVWWWLFASSGGDIAAQDAWAEFARAHPGSAYNLSWYGGMHPVSYSVLSPYLMAMLGVRTTMMVVGTLSAGLLALLLVRSDAVTRPRWPALYGAVALTGNAVSGRVTFGLGMMFGLAAVAVVYAWPLRWRSPVAGRAARWSRAALVAVLSMLAAAASPVAGLFVGVVAAALWLDGRRPAAYALGLPPVAVVALSAWLFPFSGTQPIRWYSTILPLVMAVAMVVLVPRAWRSVRLGAVVYGIGVLAVWVVPSPIGTNIVRLGLLFGGVLLVAMAAARPWPERPRLSRAVAAVLLAMALVTSSIWQVAVAARDAISTSAPAESTLDVSRLVAELRSRRADLGRVEVVPTRSHREAAALTPYVNLARGWNRQADAERNPLFYDDDTELTPDAYRAWLDRWAVRYVVLTSSEPDAAAEREAALVSGGLPYLTEVWSDSTWRLFEVRSPTPLVDPPGVVTRFDAAEIDIYVPRAATVLVRIPDSPWLSLVDENGDPIGAPGVETSPDGSTTDPPVFRDDGCLSQLEKPADQADDVPFDGWTLLHAPRAGTYRIAGPYKLPRGTACPDSVE
jgi:hypothetical protein